MDAEGGLLVTEARSRAVLGLAIEDEQSSFGSSARRICVPLPLRAMQCRGACKTGMLSKMLWQNVSDP